jgi:FixJ family two-component response regulator
MSTPTVFIVDDAREVRIALSRLLSVAGYAVRSFESAERFLSEQDDSSPGCVLLDLAMPGLSGLDVQRILAEGNSERTIIFLTAQGDIQASVRAMKAGAVDFLTKPVTDTDLFAAVDRAMEVDRTNRTARAIRRAIDLRRARLTPRETQVFEAVVCGNLNKQIAASLGVGEKTVKVHRARMMIKMGVRSVAQLVRLATQVNGAIEAPPLAQGGPAAQGLKVQLARPSCRGTQEAQHAG